MDIINYSVLYLLELAQVERDEDIMKASDLCQNGHIFTGDSNYGFYYELQKDEYDELIALGAEIETFKNVSVLHFSNKTEFLDYCNSHKCIDTMTVLGSGYPKRDYFYILRDSISECKDDVALADLLYTKELLND